MKEDVLSPEKVHKPQSLGQVHEGRAGRAWSSLNNDKIKHTNVPGRQNQTNLLLMKEITIQIPKILFDNQVFQTQLFKQQNNKIKGKIIITIFFSLAILNNFQFYKALKDFLFKNIKTCSLSYLKKKKKSMTNKHEFLSDAPLPFRSFFSFLRSFWKSSNFICEA